MGSGSLNPIGELPRGAKGTPLIEWVSRNILPKVQKPGRYIAGELWPPKGVARNERASVVLAFPDVYEIGAGHLGLSLLQHALRNEPDIRVERTYCPWPDMEQAMRSHGVPLYSLQSYTPCGEFDIFAVTIQHELAYTNILTLLDLSGIALLHADRDDNQPLVIGGGPATCNPEPVAPFFDLFVIGDGEVVFPELVRFLVECRRRGTSRIDSLRGAASFEGVYVPSLYEPSYGVDSGYDGLNALFAGAPTTIRPAVVGTLEGSNYPMRPSVPVIGMTHDRHTIEIMRGCPRRCRFCQAVQYYSPLRFRQPEDISEDAVSGAMNSGWDEVSLLGLSCSDYPEIASLLRNLNTELLSRRVSISLPSLRADSVNEDICRELARSRTGGLTLAPEAGTERLRRRIGKSLRDDDLLRAVDLALSNGWTGIKLYFMVGLPGEEPDDIEGIIRLARAVGSISKRHRARRVTVSCSPFVPKPHTPFEREPFVAVDILQGRLDSVRNRLQSRRLQFKWRDPKIARWETVFARGDRRLAKAILYAWRAGARFDEWERHLMTEVWEESLHHAELAPEYGLQSKGEGETLPWSHIVLPGVTSLGSTPTSVPKPPRVASGRPSHPIAEVRLRMRVEFRKVRLLKFLSHLDLVRVWRLVLRRAGLGAAYTEGLSPRLRLSLGPALSLGIEGLAEVMEFWLPEPMPDDLQETLEKHAPTGLEILRVKPVVTSTKSLELLAVGADYSAELKGIMATMPTVRDPLELGLTGVESLELRDGMLFFSLRRDAGRAVKPRAVVARVVDMPEEDSLLIPLARRGLWAEQGGARVPLFDAV